MPGRHDGSIIFNTALDNSEIPKGIKEIEGEFGGLKSAVSQTSKTITDAFSKSIAVAQSKVNDLERQFETVTSAFKNAIAMDDDAAAEKLANKQIHTYNQLETARERLAIAVQEAARNQSEEEQRQSEKSAEAARIVSKSVKSIGKSYDSAKASVNRFGSRLKSIVLGAFFFNGISAGLRSIASYFGDAITSTDEMRTALANLKGAAAVAFAPIIEIATPAIVDLTNALAKAIAKLANFISLLTGKSISKMKETAGTIANVGIEVRKTVKSLAGFDEINVLTDNKNGGGISTGTISPNYDFVTDQTLELAEQIGNLNISLDDMVTLVAGVSTGILGWRVSGSFLGGLAVALATIAAINIASDWENVTGWFSGAGDTIAGLFEGLVTGDWDRFNEGLNQAWKSWLSSDFMPENIATGIMKMLGFDTDTMYGQILSYIEGGGSMMDIFGTSMAMWIEELKSSSAFGSIFKALGILMRALGADAFAGFLLGISEGIDNIGTWVKENVFAPVYEAWCNAWGIHSPADTMVEPGKNVVYGFLNGILEAFASIGTWIKENVFDPFIEAFLRAFGIHSPADTMKDPGKNVVFGFLNGILDGIADIGTWIKENVFDPFIQGFKSAFGISKENDSSVMKRQGGGLISSLLSGISSAWNDIPGFFTEAMEDLRETVDGIWNGEGGIGSVIKKAINAIIGFINGMLFGIGAGINSVIAALNKINFSLPDWEILGDDAGKSIGFNLRSVSVPRIPYLAQGAVLPANKPFMAVVGDQKHGTNVEAPLTTIQEAVALVMEDFNAANMAGHQATVAVLREILEAVLGIHIGDDVIANAVSRYQDKMAVVKGGGL